MSSCNFLEVCRDVTKTARKIPQSDYLSQGNYKIFDQGKQYIAGYTNDSEGMVSDYPYIVFGDHTRILKFVTEPCFIGADGVKLLKVYNEDFMPQYVYYALLAQPIENQGYSRHFKYLKELSISIYTKEEQNAIISELDKIQAALDNKKEQLKKLDELIQSKFYEMFGDPVVNDKGWEKESLKNITTKIGSGSTPKGGNESYKRDGVSLIRSMNVYNNSFKYKDLAYIDDIQANGLKNVVVLENDILLNITGASVARSCIVPANILPARVNQHVAIIRIIDNFSNKFISYQLTNPTYQQELLTLSKGKGGTREALTKGQLEELLVILPPLPLQQAFAAYVEKVEKAKAIVNQEIAHLQELLNSRMDLYFRK